MKYEFKKWFLRLYWLVDVIVLLILYFLTLNNEDLKTFNSICIILLIASIIFNVIYLYRYMKGKSAMARNIKNYRVQSFSGFQGCGKTSVMFNICGMFFKKNAIFSNVPFTIDNEYCNILTKDAFCLRSRLPQNSVITGDELTLLFNNLDQSKSRQDIAGAEGNMQMVRHNFDGYIFATSVNMNRLLAVLEEKFGLDNMMLEQTSIKTGFIVPLIYWICRKFNDKLPKVYWGYRRWKIQTFLTINKKNYNYDLSTDVANSKTNRFVNLYYFYAFNDGSIKYDDRFASELYKNLPPIKVQKYTSLKYNQDIVTQGGFESLQKLYDVRNKKYIANAKSDNELEPTDSVGANSKICQSSDKTRT